ncbi:ATP-binding cassette domain-containing protein [Embleya sp. NPDC050154]|uniref:ATP-binding cassette domain-containing protein n=1 Tax=Embleya sp. NPDC050154 TaxID=3363988 RepID=UPI0037B29451
MDTLRRESDAAASNGTKPAPDPLLRIENLVVEYRTAGRRKPPLRVLHEVSLDVRPHETVGLVGESGSGKTTLGRAVLGLVPVASGTIAFDGSRIDGLTRRARRALSRDIQVIFQDPYGSLNPSMTIGDILTEPLTAGRTHTRAAARARIGELLDAVGLPTDTADRLARELSGGQRQRVAIARALAPGPRLIICDEPVSALDLSTRAQVLNLLVELQQRTGVAYLFIAHDLSVVGHVSDRVAVMSKGAIVECDDARRITTEPVHPYTRNLLLAAPVPDPARQADRRAARHRLAREGAAR